MVPLAHGDNVVPMAHETGVVPMAHEIENEEPEEEAGGHEGAQTIQRAADCSRFATCLERRWRDMERARIRSDLRRWAVQNESRRGEGMSGTASPSRAPPHPRNRCCYATRSGRRCPIRPGILPARNEAPPRCTVVGPECGRIREIEVGPESAQLLPGQRHREQGRGLRQRQQQEGLRQR